MVIDIFLTVFSIVSLVPIQLSLLIADPSCFSTIQAQFSSFCEIDDVTIKYSGDKLQKPNTHSTKVHNLKITIQIMLKLSLFPKKNDF